jgi:hypothetical protein
MPRRRASDGAAQAGDAKHSSPGQDTKQLQQCTHKGVIIKRAVDSMR